MTALLVIIIIFTVSGLGCSIGDKQHPFTGIGIADPEASPLCIVYYRRPGLEINANSRISTPLDHPRNLGIASLLALWYDERLVGHFTDYLKGR
jgi:hypothetical protein